MAELPATAVSFERHSPLLLKATVKDKSTGHLLVEFNETEQLQEDITTSADEIPTNNSLDVDGGLTTADKSNVLLRRVFNVRYYSEKAQIYDNTAIILASGVAVNSTQAGVDLTVEVSYKDTSSSTFTNSMPISGTVPVNSMITTAFPLIMKGGNTVNIPTYAVTKPFQWNVGIMETSFAGNVVYGLGVPPMTQLRYNVVWKGATCSIPFSYTQTDNNVATQYDDGVYIGFNNYDLQIGNDQIPI